MKVGDRVEVTGWRVKHPKVGVIVSDHATSPPSFDVEFPDETFAENVYADDLHVVTS